MFQVHLTVVDVTEPVADPLPRIRVGVLPPTGIAGLRPMTLSRSAESRVSLTFTDAAGVRWSRDVHGRLAELESRPVIWGAEHMESVLEQFDADLAG